MDKNQDPSPDPEPCSRKIDYCLGEEKGEKEKGEKEKEGGEEDSKDEESVGGADGEEKEGEDQIEQVINYSVFFVT